MYIACPLPDTLNVHNTLEETIRPGTVRCGVNHYGSVDWQCNNISGYVCIQLQEWLFHVPEVSQRREGELHEGLESWQGMYQDELARGQGQQAGKICSDTW